MKNYLVIYYSKTGNSRFLAEQVAQQLEADIILAKPILNSIFIQFLLSSMKVGVPNNLSTRAIARYDEVVIFGPVWGGLLISPLRRILHYCIQADRPIHFALSCETSDQQKEDKYGYAGVLSEARRIGGKLLKTTAAFPTTLVKEGDPTWSPKLSEKVKITEENFRGTMKARLEHFVSEIRLVNKTAPNARLP